MLFETSNTHGKAKIFNIAHDYTKVQVGNTYNVYHSVNHVHHHPATISSSQPPRRDFVSEHVEDDWVITDLEKDDGTEVVIDVILSTENLWMLVSFSESREGGSMA
ncbi:hypothetical protein HWV62_4125 [Athelia sp. TMB]|nr:hypothetical protein HWV62_4125 [Athelia sp. TMB]